MLVGDTSVNPSAFALLVFDFDLDLLLKVHEQREDDH